MTTLIDIPVTRSQILNCSFSSWYPKYQKHSPKAEILNPLPEKFVEYLLQDGIKLPSGAQLDGSDYSDWSEEEGEPESVDQINPVVDFPEFHALLETTIKKLGAVAPKLNWSAPRDATWILTSNSTKCSNVEDLYLILNASNYIMHDLVHAFDDTQEKSKDTDCEFELVLRQWFNINPALEFRCFVREGNLVGVCQRDENYYDYLEPLRDTFKDLIDGFLDDVLCSFPDPNFVFDVYLPRPFEKVWLIDINPWSRTTDSLMFSWNELQTLQVSDDYELRLVSSNNVARFATAEHSENHVPKDIVEASLDPNVMADLARKWKDLLTQQEAETSEEDD